MILILLLFLAALTLEGIGSLISVIGLAATFAADPIILTMAVVLDFCKIIAVNTMAKKWSSLSATIRVYLIASTLVLSVITSAGSAGYLSNSFQKAMIPNQGNNIVLVSMKAEQERLLTRKTEIDAQVAALPSNQVNGRKRLIQTFKGETDHINSRLIEIDAEIPKIQTNQVKLHTEVGAIMFLADVANISPEKAVGIIIALIIFVFDPMAIVFLIVANSLMIRRNLDKTKKQQIDDEKKNLNDTDEPETIKPIEPDQDPDPPTVQDIPEEPTVLEENKQPLQVIQIENNPEKSTSSRIIDEPKAEAMIAEVVSDYVHHTDNQDTVIIPEYIKESEPIIDEIIDKISNEIAIETSPEEISVIDEEIEELIIQDPIVNEHSIISEVSISEEVQFAEAPLDIPTQEIESINVEIDPIAAILSNVTDSNLEEVLKEILKDRDSEMTDSEREKLDRALDRIFALEPQREMSDEPETEEVEYIHEIVAEVPEALPVDSVIEPDSVLHDPTLDTIKDSDVQFVGPLWVNPKLLDIYATKK